VESIFSVGEKWRGQNFVSSKYLLKIRRWRDSCETKSQPCPRFRRTLLWSDWQRMYWRAARVVSDTIVPVTVGKSLPAVKAKRQKSVCCGHLAWISHAG